MSTDCADERDVDQQHEIYHQQGKELLSSGKYSQARACFRRAIDTLDERPQNNVVLDVLSDYIVALEAMIEERASFNNDGSYTINSRDDYEDVQELLEDVAAAYGRISEIKSLRASMLNEDVADASLDYAIAAKRAGNWKQCAIAHLKRMGLCPQYKVTDAVRLLGLASDFIDSATDESLCICDGAEEICRRGVFEADIDECQRYQSSNYAKQLGEKARNVLRRHQYSLQGCREYLLPHISNPSGQPISKERIFSANSFFNHRHDIAEEIDDEGIDTVSGLLVLALFFLFGIAVNKTTAECAIGKADLDALVSAGLLRQSAARSSDVVAEVQIYPLSHLDLSGKEAVRNEGNYYFVTDFPMESMRLPRNAIMPVGYDTLELLSLSAGARRNPGERVLDMCCGSGIQGIFAAFCCTSSRNVFDDDNGLVMADINERAMHFAAANLALNGIHRGACAVRGDLFDALDIIGHKKFDLVLSNPPFVAVPSSVSPQLQPALYAIGGGTDGMHILRHILAKCLDFLESNNTSIILMVTEVPNVQESCTMLRSFLPEDKRCRARIRVAYVDDDVETSDSYSHEREVEAGIECATRDWSVAICSDGIYNRALVLISITYDKGDDKNGIYSYKGGDGMNGREVEVESDSTANDADEEDAFLKPTGVAFARRALL